MDLPPWDTSNDQGYPTSVSNYVEDVLQQDLFYGQDLIEEDALKEKSCIEVLRNMINKADDEIMELEEDLLMLRCELAWDDDNWSKLCSAVLKEKIDHLDILMRSLKKEGTENVSDFSTQLEPPEMPERLHDLLKPLLENYLVNSKQPEAQKSDKAAESDQNLCPKEEIVIGSSSTENSKAQKDGGPQTNTRESKRQCIEDGENLTIYELKDIAKNQKLRGYSRLSKKDLRERLKGLGHL